MSNRHFNNLRNFADYVSLLVVTLAVIIIILLSKWMFTAQDLPVIEKHDYTITINLDTAINSNHYDSLLFALNMELDKISYETSFEINELFNKQQEIHQSFREAEQRQNKFLTYASALIAIIAALGGFFGFKSFIDIKKQIIDDAQRTAQAEARDAAQRIADGSLTTELNSQMSAKSEETFFRLFGPFEEQFNRLSERVDEYCPEQQEVASSVIEQVDTPDANESTTFNDNQL